MAERLDAPIKAGSRWSDERVSFVVGKPGQVRVMAAADGYVMIRFPHCMPFVMGEREFRRAFRLINAPSPDRSQEEGR